MVSAWYLLTKFRVIFLSGGKGAASATENGSSLGALAPEGTRLQGLKAQLVGVPEAARLKPRPSKAPRYHGDFRH